MILHKGKKAVLTVSAGKDKYAYDLKKDTVISVDGAIGKTTIIIKNGEAFITDSPCPNKTCVHSGKIKRPGECLCCAPNKVFACVEGQQDENEKTDAVAY